MRARCDCRWFQTLVAQVAVLLGFAFGVCLQPVWSWAETFVPGQIVRLECKPNPFDPSKITPVRVYADASAYSALVYEGCNLKMRVAGIKGGWVQVQDQEGKTSGFVSQGSLVLIQDVAATPVAGAKASEQHPKPDNPPSAGPASLKEETTTRQVPQGWFSRPETAGGSQAPPAVQGQASGAPAGAVQGWPGAGQQAEEKSTPNTRQSSGAPATPAANWPGASGPSSATRPPENAPHQPLGFGPPGQAARPDLQGTPSMTPANEVEPKSEKGKSAKVHEEGKKGKPPTRCSSLYIKMSMGKVLNREEEEFLRRHCN